MKYFSIFIALLTCTTYAREYNLVDKQKLESIFNMKADVYKEEEVVRFNFPRTDMNVIMDGCQLNPFLGVGSYVAFKKGSRPGTEAMIMGDIIMREHEVHEALTTALNNDIRVTALHNHYFFNNPNLYFMHIDGEGDTSKLAQDIKKIFESIKKSKHTNVSKRPSKNNISARAIENIFSIKGQAHNGMFKIIIGRDVKAGCGCTVGKSMGVNTWAAFSGTNDNAMVVGDFAVLEDELQPVLKSLVNNGITIVAIHNHMTHETPRMLFLHYYGLGKAVELAKSLKKALSKTTTLS